MKAYKRALLTGVCMLWFCFRVMPQLCPSSALAPVFTQDFGQGATALSTTAAVPGSTNYVFGGVGTDGNYVITPSFDVSGKADWTKLGDHTGNTFGNMFLVNAGGGKSIFFKQTVNGLCSGSTFNFSAWLANANTSATTGVCGGGYKYPNVIFNIKNTSGTVLATFNTGNLPLSPVNGPANWVQYGFQFTLPAGTSSLVLEMVDFWGGAAACGNDLALDDILFTACTPQVTVSLSTGPTPICSGSSPIISTSLVNSPFTTPAYQWQKSTDNGVTWNNVGTPGTSANNFPLSNVSATDGGIYRVLVGPDVPSLSSNSCITASNPITVTVNQRPAVSVSNNGPACSGNTLTLTPAVTGGTSPFSYSWSGPNSFSSTSTIASIATVATAASGTYSLTLTDAKGCVVSASSTVTVNATPVVAAISGTTGGCVGTNLTMSDVTPAGTWSSDNTAVATITNAGLVTVLSPGSAVISYSVTSNGCSQAATKTISTASVQLQNDVIACNNAAIHFDQNPFIPAYSGSLPADTYNWTMTSIGGTITYKPGSTPASQFPYVQLQDGFIYSIALQYTTNGVTCSDTQVIYKYIIPADTIQTSHDTTICNSITVISLSGTASAVTNSFLWSTNGTGIFSSPASLNTNYTPSVADKAAGNIKIYLTGSSNLNITGSCPSSGTAIDSMILRIAPPNTGTNASQTICSKQPLSFTPSSSVAGSVFSWTSVITSGTATGNAVSGTGSINDVLVNTSSSSNAVVTYTVTPYSVLPGGSSCAGTPFTLTATVNPVAVINAINTSSCSGSAFGLTPVNVTNGVIPSGTTYTWGVPTGVGFSGGATQITGISNINGQLANATNTAVTAVYMVTPLSGTCPGSAFTVTVTVNPVNILSAMTAITCSGTGFSVTPVNGVDGIILPGTQYSWASPSVTGGITGGAVGTNAPGINGVLTNPSVTSQTAVYTVTPQSGICTGSAFTLTVTVNPAAVINPIVKATYSGIAFSATPANIVNGTVPAGTTYSWPAPAVTGGMTGGMSASTTGTISGTLLNTTNIAQTATYTVTPVTGTCTGAPFTVTVIVNPVAVINAMTAVVCSGGVFSITPVNIVNGIVPAGTTYSWSTPLVTGGISGGAPGINAGSISGSLTNTVNTQQTATYVVTPVSGGYPGSSFTLTITVNPTAVINVLTAVICSGTSFAVTPTNVVNGIIPAGTTYSWAVPAVTGGLNGGLSAANKTGISGTLNSPANTTQTATYTVTPVTGACSGNAFTVTVTVAPVAAINAMTATSCSGITFTVTPTNVVNGIIPTGTTYSWPAPVVTGGLSGGASATGTTNISGTLNNPTNTAQTGTYTVTQVSGACGGASFTVTVGINPVAVINAMTAIICSGSAFAVTPTNAVNGIIPAGTTYSWSTPVVTGGLSGGLSATNKTGISGTLSNPTNTVQTAIYTVTPVAGSCSGTSFTVTVTVNPVAAINAMTAVICSGSTFTLTPTNAVNGIIPAGTIYSWPAPLVTGGLTGSAGATNTINISGTLNNPTNTAQTATYTVTPLTGACGGTSFTLTVSVNPVATINAMTATICSGSIFTITPTNAVNGIIPAGTIYSWTAPAVTGGLTGGAGVTSTTNISGILNNPTNIAQTATYTVTPVTGACGSTSFTLTVSVNPVVAINAMAAVICSGSTFTVTPTNVVNGIIPTGTTYSWTAPVVTGGLTGGQAASNTTNIAGSLNNPTNTAQTATYTLTPLTGACSGTSFTVTVAVNPVATINAMTAITCSGTAFTLTPTNIANGIIPAGTIYSWSTPVVTGGLTGGQAATNTTNIAGSLNNPTNTTQTATYLITPGTGVCNGASFTVTVTVNPFAVVNAMTAITCSGTAFTITPTNTVNGIIPAGTTYSWTAPVVTGGLTGSAGATNTTNVSGTLSNPTNTTQTATYTVTPVTGACSGASFSVTVTVNPIAVINAMTAIICSGSTFMMTPTNAVNGIIPAGTTYSWTTPAVTGGLTGGQTASNTTNIAGALSNPTNTAQTATYTVTPVTGACGGTSFTLTVSVNPVAAINAMTAIICSGSTFTVTPTNIVNGIIPAGTTYSWTTPVVTGGLTGSAGATNTINISGTLNNPTNTAQTATYTLTPLTGACGGASFTVTVAVNPVAAINAMTAIICSGSTFMMTPTNAVNGIIPAGTIYSWTTPSVTGGLTGGANATSTTNISGSLNNPTNIAQTATYTVIPVAGACSGASFTVTVSVNPVAVINTMTATICSGTTFTVTPTNIVNGIIPAGTSYSWTAPVVTGGLIGGQAATNTTNITGTLSNPTNTVQTATYTVTPVAGSCSGASFTVTVTVNPVAAINAMTAIICSGSAFTLTPTNIVNGIIPAGTTYSWPVPIVTGGLTSGANATGITNISGSLNNPTNTAQTATYTITPASGLCSGATFTVTVTIDPVAVINAMTTATCSGVSFTITPTNVINGIIPAGTTYNWTAPAVTGGLSGGLSAVNKTGISGTLNNPTNTTQTATYIVTPVTGLCNGTSFTVIVTVNPVAVINAMTAITCSGVSFTVTPTNAVNGIIPAGTIYSWTTPSVTGGLTGGANATSTTNISGTLNNPTNIAQTATYTVTPVAGPCSSASFTVTVTVNPVAVINAMTATTCSGVLFTITPTNAVNGIIPAGTIYSWATPVVTGGLAGGSSATNTTNIAGTLNNPTNTVQTATYIVTPVTSACSGASFTVTITVNPVAVINAMTAIICNGSAFILTPTNAVNGIIPAGTIYNWSTPSVTGGLTGGISATNTTNIAGTLNNSTNTAQTATYTITPVTGACNGASFTITVTVNPVAVINAMTAIICSGSVFTLTPTNVINGIIPAGTIYSWSAPVVTGGLTGGQAATNTTNILGSLNNPTNTTQTATYIITPVTGACGGTSFTFTVSVNPVAAINAMTAVICSGSTFTVTPTNIVNGIIPAGTTYSWTTPVVTGGLIGSAGATNTINISGTLNNPTNTAQTATYTVTPVTGACGGASFTVTVTVSPVATINAMTAIICSGSAFTLTPTNIVNGIIPTGTTYSWTAPVVTGGLIGGTGATNTTNIAGTFSNPTNTAQTATYTVAPVTGACGGTSFTLTVSVNPVAAINAMTATICSGSAFTLTPTNIVNGIIPTGTTYSWSTPSVTGGLTGGANATNTTNISGTLNNPTNTVQTATYIITPVTGACSGTSFTITVTIDPAAVINAMTTVTCSGSAFTLTPTNIVNGIIPAGTTYSWSTSSVTGGLTGGSGATNTTTIAGALNNPTNTVQTATYTVTPVAGLCSGASFTVTVTVNPLAVINAMTAITCSGIAFTVTPTNVVNGIIPAGTTYSWTAPFVTGGLTGAVNATNTTNITGAVSNPTNTTQTATYTVAPVAGSCSGASFTIIVTVNPVAVINAMTAIICSGTSFTLTPVNAVNGIIPAGTTYSWATPVVTGGLTGGQAATNTTNILGSLNNTTNTTQTATYIITPVAGACGGNPFTVTVTVNPIAVINAMTATICSGASFVLSPTNIVNGIIPTGTSYSWTAPVVTGGLTGGAGATNTTNIAGSLNNPTNTTQTATYTVTPIAGACGGVSFTVTVVVNTVAVINAMTATICSGTTFTLTPTNIVNGIIPAGTTYSWTAPIVTGGLSGGAGATNTTNISGTLNNPTNTAQTATYTITPVTGACGGVSFTVSVVVNPVAAINAMTATICSGTTFTLTPTNIVNGVIPAGTAYGWTAPIVTGGLSGGAGATNTTNVSGTLNNPTNTAQTATYTITPATGICGGASFTVTVTVNPFAVINAMTAISCSGTAFTLTPTNVVNGIIPAGTSYSWTTTSVTGGLTGGAGATNTTNVSGTLNNPANTTQTATYMVTPLAGACVGTSFTVTVTVNPVATINAMTAIICNGSAFALTPTNAVNGIVPAGTIYNWSAPSVTGSLTGGAGTTNAINIAGALNNSSNTAQTATYSVTPISGICPGNAFTVTVTINPAAVIGPITASVCSGTPFTLIPANITNGIVPSTTTYSWGIPSISGGSTGAAAGTNNTFINATLINATNTTQTATYSVTPVSGNCPGSAFTVTVMIRPLPKAELTIIKSIGCTPFTVDNSNVSAVLYPAANAGYEWYVDNSLIGSGSNFPSYILSSASAVIKLKVTSLYNCGTDNVTTVVKVYDSPNPSFTLSDSTGCGPLAINIVNTTPDLSSYQYKWDLGNGQYSNLAQPGLINYPASVLGNDTVYTAILKAYQYCDTFSVSKQIIVSRKARLDFTTALQNNCSPLKVLFTNKSVGKQVQYHISYGDGIDSTTGTNLQYAHTYYAGTQITYPATLTAANSCGIDSLVVPVAILPNAVRIDLTLSDSVVCGNPFALTIDNRTDSANGFTWDLGDGSAIQATAGKGLIQHTYQSAGTYLIKNAIAGNCSDTVIYRRLIVYPSVKALANTLPQNNCIGTPISFKNLSDSSLSAKWIFGDGSVSDSSAAVHYFAQAGTYAAKLSVWKTHQEITCTDTSHQPVTIVSTKQGRFTLSDSVGKCLPFAVSFVNQNKPAQTKWNWGDGQVSTGDAATHSFTSNGSFTVSMQSIQNGGCSFVDTAVVNVIAPAVALQYKGGAYCQQNNSIEFTAVSSRTDSIRWEFGDGITMMSAGSQKVSHSYSRAGSFIPKLTLMSTDNCNVPVIAQDSIHIDEINAGFKLLAINDCAKTDYRFTDTSRSFFPIVKRLWTMNQHQATASATPTSEGNEKEISQIYTKAGEYDAALEVQNRIGCKASLDAKFNVAVYEFPKANINSISEACLYNLMEIKSLVVSQDSVIRRIWNLGNGAAATDSVVKIFYNKEGVYTLSLTVGTINSCYDSVYKQLSIHPLPTLVLATDRNVCKGDSLQLKATGAVGYIWKDQNDNILCNNCNELKVTPQKNAQFKVIGYNEFGCSNITSTNVRVIQPFKLDLLTSDSMCEGSSRRIVANGADNYIWFPAPGLSSYTSAVTYATPAVTTTYKVIGKDGFNCFADTASIQLVIGKPTPVSVGRDTTIIAGTPIQLNTGTLPPDIRQWQWGGKADYSCVYCASPMVKVIDDGPLTVKATNQFGCITTDTLNIKTFCSGAEVFIPNAFTPDGDGVNDVLILQGRGIKIVKSLRIYSRWGEMVYEKTNFQPGDRSAGWDGKIRGKLANPDVFVYLCEAVCEKGAAYTLKGNVAIIK